MNDWLLPVLGPLLPRLEKGRHTVLSSEAEAQPEAQPATQWGLATGNTSRSSSGQPGTPSIEPLAWRVLARQRRGT